MNLYNCVVRVSGSLHNEVPRFGVTAPEVLMLQHLHGEDAVRNITHVGVSDEFDAAIRDRMIAFYGTGTIDSPRSGEALVRQVFGPKMQRLPDTLDGVKHLDDKPEIVLAPATIAGKVAKPVSLTTE